jgi:BirA family biotin operon repressor/biotin-[acetyl-CoA-carboxylase] ligase
MVSPYTDLDRPPLRSSSLTRALVREGSLWHEVRVLAQVTSTNAVVAEAASGGMAEGLVVVAEQQTAGRGRLGRNWSSPLRSGLTFSVLLRPTRVAESRWTWLPLLTGLAVATAIDDMAGVEVGLKWPNDLLVEGRKVGGILVERYDGAVVVGVGVNVTTTEAELPTDAAVSLALADAAVTDRESLLRAVLRSIDAHYSAWRDAAGDPDSLLLSYTERCHTIGAPLRAELPDGSTVEGVGERIDEHGRLVVRTGTGDVALTSGDVIHVRAQ